MMQHDVVVGVDVGKSFHWVYAVDQQDQVIYDQNVDQDERQLDALFAGLAGGGKRVLVVVDQPKNIGALTLACAVRAGCDVACLPGLAMRRAAGMLPGDAKTDHRDAQVIAVTAKAMPQTLRHVDTSGARADLVVLASFDRDCLVDRTRQVNRLHALLAEVNPVFEKTVYARIDSVFILALLARFGGPWGIKTAGRAKVTAWAGKQKRVPKEALAAVLDAAWAMDHQPAGAAVCEQIVIPAVVARIAELTLIRKTNQARIDALLSADPTYQVLRTMPGVGPATAAALVTTVDIDMFENHDKLASYAGLAARTRQSGTSIKHETASRAGNRQLKNALFLSAFAALNWDPQAKAFYDAKRAAGKQHNTAIIALARKRLKIMYAIMRNNTPYQT